MGSSSYRCREVSLAADIPSPPQASGQHLPGEELVQDHRGSAQAEGGALPPPPGLAQVLVPAPRARADLQWLLQQGHRVVALHQDRLAVASLLVSLGLEHSCSRDQGGWRYQDSRVGGGLLHLLVLLQGQLLVHTAPFLSLLPNLGMFDALYDGGAIACLPPRWGPTNNCYYPLPRLQDQVVTQLTRAMVPGARGLLAGWGQPGGQPPARLSILPRVRMGETCQQRVSLTFPTSAGRFIITVHTDGFWVNNVLCFCMFL